jgi:cytochrome c-type biogenesis protein
LSFWSITLEKAVSKQGMETFFQWEQALTSTVQGSLTQISPLSLGLVFLAGILTSFSPCTLSMLPITVGYIAGQEQKSMAQTALQCLWFILGLSMTLTALGLVAGLVGSVYGKLPYPWLFFTLIGLLAVTLGLFQLEIINFRLPRLAFLDTYNPPEAVKPLFIGATFGLVASPCTSPVLFALLGFVSTSKSPWLGAAFLFSYALGHGLPLVLAGLFTGMIKGMMTLRKYSGVLTQGSGVLLVGVGVWMVLTHLPTS